MLDQTSLRFTVETLAFATETLTIQLAETSPYLEQKKADEAQSLAEARKAAQRRNLTVNSTVSGSRYGNAIRLYRDTKYFNCVSYAKAMTGVSGTIGNGARVAAVQRIPRVGVIGAMKGRAHAVVVTAISGDMITFTESNYERGWITQRTAPLSMFIGFVYTN